MPSRTPVPGALPKAKSKEAARPRISGPGPRRDRESFGQGRRWGWGNLFGEKCGRMTSQCADPSRTPPVLPREGGGPEDGQLLRDKSSCIHPPETPLSRAEGRAFAERLIAYFDERSVPGLALTDFLFFF